MCEDCDVFEECIGVWWNARTAIAAVLGAAGAWWQGGGLLTGLCPPQDAQQGSEMPAGRRLLSPAASAAAGAAIGSVPSFPGCHCCRSVPRLTRGLSMASWAYRAAGGGCPHRPVPESSLASGAAALRGCWGRLQLHWHCHYMPRPRERTRRWLAFGRLTLHQWLREKLQNYLLDSKWKWQLAAPARANTNTCKEEETSLAVNCCG